MITLKEQAHAAYPQLRFLVGEKRVRPTQIPVFEDGTSQKVIWHKESLTEQVTVWHVLGFGRTADKARAMARETVGPDFFMPEPMGCVARFETENQVTA